MRLSAYIKGMKTKGFADMMRQTMKADGRTKYAIARDAGLNPAVVARFLTGERDITLTTAEKICRVLGLELRPGDAAAEAGQAGWPDQSRRSAGGRLRTTKKGG